MMLNRLVELGLDVKEARFYLTVLELGEATVRQIAEAAGVSRTNAYDILDRLARRGLVSQLEVGPTHRTMVVATDPQRLVDEWEERGRRLESIVPQLRAMHHKTGVRPRVRYYEGVEGIQTVLYGTLHLSSSLLGILSMRDLLTVPGKTVMDHYVSRRAETGVRLRVIRSREKETEDMWPTDPRALREARYAPTGRVFTMTMFLGGDTVALISSRRENFALTIESPEYAELQRNMFEILWEASLPTIDPVSRPR
ncbi:MAG: helix-turn-helix domain-containing protein [Propionibacteriales bacterium]|nr:helix-turn-helix domain-containing protein [Propionibacteriales bacterium]